MSSEDEQNDRDNPQKRAKKSLVERKLVELQRKHAGRWPEYKLCAWANIPVTNFNHSWLIFSKHYSLIKRFKTTKMFLTFNRSLARIIPKTLHQTCPTLERGNLCSPKKRPGHPLLRVWQQQILQLDMALR